mmetsp:Transcript_115746/g.332501  ORF Transcript_115746/g.332501 Transcript_115746/m.332501 type:complete len:257 (+) Transcript_115746:111-881(+)
MRARLKTPSAFRCRGRRISSWKGTTSCFPRPRRSWSTIAPSRCGRRCKLRRPARCSASVGCSSTTTKRRMPSRKPCPRVGIRSAADRRAMPRLPRTAWKLLLASLRRPSVAPRGWPRGRCETRAASRAARGSSRGSRSRCRRRPSRRRCLRDRRRRPRRRLPARSSRASRTRHLGPPGTWPRKCRLAPSNGTKTRRWSACPPWAAAPRFSRLSSMPVPSFGAALRTPLQTWLGIGMARTLVSRRGTACMRWAMSWR